VRETEQITVVECLGIGKSGSFSTDVDRRQVDDFERDHLQKAGVAPPPPPPQCMGSGSGTGSGSACFWVSRIRIIQIVRSTDPDPDASLSHKCVEWTEMSRIPNTAPTPPPAVAVVATHDSHPREKAW
jgi:hypothetical protein